MRVANRTCFCAVCRVPEECPHEVSELISKCCSSDKDSRPSAAEITQFLKDQIDQYGGCAATDSIEKPSFASLTCDAKLLEASFESHERLSSTSHSSSSSSSTLLPTSQHSSSGSNVSNCKEGVRKRRHVAEAMLNGLQDFWRHAPQQ